MTFEVWVKLGKFKDKDSALAYVEANSLKNVDVKEVFSNEK